MPYKKLIKHSYRLQLQLSSSKYLDCMTVLLEYLSLAYSAYNLSIRLEIYFYVSLECMVSNTENIFSPGFFIIQFLLKKLTFKLWKLHLKAIKFVRNFRTYWYTVVAWSGKSKHDFHIISLI